MGTIVMRVMGLLFFRSRLTDDMLMAHHTILSYWGRYTVEEGNELRRTIKLSLLYWNA